MNKQTVWIINQYATTPEVGMGGRHFYLARELAKQGHSVYVVAASYTHLHRNTPNVKGQHLEQLIDGVHYIWIKVPFYADAHSKKRILNWFEFAWKIKGLGKIIKNQPDSIIYSSPSLIGFLGANSLKKKFKCKIALEIRDIWPLTLIKIGGFSQKHPFILFMQFIERYAYKHADIVLSNLRNSVQHMKEQGMDDSKFKWIPNGISLDEVTKPEKIPSSIHDAIPKGKFVIGYAGTMGLANALDYLIEAAEILKDNTDVFFVLLGGGKERSTLEKLVNDKELDNVLFIDPVKKSQIQSVLNLFDVCYIGWRDEDLYQFGIAPNKLPEYMYANKPILHSFSGYGDYVVESGAGLSVPAEDPYAIAEGINLLYEMTDTERSELGRNGREFVLKNLEYNHLASDLSEVIF